MTAEEAALLSSRLLHSEQTRKDIKEELSKVRHDCIRRQGAEVSHFCVFCLVRIITNHDRHHYHHAVPITDMCLNVGAFRQSVEI